MTRTIIAEGIVEEHEKPYSYRRENGYDSMKQLKVDGFTLAEGDSTVSSDFGRYIGQKIRIEVVDEE